jgi:hypothetical protein
LFLLIMTIWTICILHGFDFVWLNMNDVGSHQALPKFSLLLLLNQIARSAEACAKAVLAA